MFGDSKNRAFNYELIILNRELKDTSDIVRQQMRITESGKQTEIYWDLKYVVISLQFICEKTNTFWRKRWREEMKINRDS